MTYKYGLTATTPVWVSTLRDSQSHELMYRVVGFSQAVAEARAREVAEELGDLIIDEAVQLELADMLSSAEVDSQHHLVVHGGIVLEA